MKAPPDVRACTLSAAVKKLQAADVSFRILETGPPRSVGQGTLAGQKPPQRVLAQRTAADGTVVLVAAPEMVSAILR